MTDFVKNFIEENIESIEDEDWEEIVSLWYGAAFSNYDYDELCFAEFVEVLKSIGIDFMFSSRHDRYDFLYARLSDLLGRYIKNAKINDVYSIKKKDIVNTPVTKLGFTTEEVTQLLDKVAEHEYSLNVDSDEYYI